MVDKISLDVLGSSGLKQSAGIIDEEFHPKLKGRYGPLLYREMTDNSSVIGAINYLIKILVRQTEWRIEASSEDKKSKEAAEFIESCIDDMEESLDGIISQMLSMLNYGWAYFEILYKLRKGDTKDPTTTSLYNDGKFGWRNFAIRSQDSLERWEFDKEDTDKLLGMWQLAENASQSVLIPIEKALHLRTENAKNNPEGRSILRNMVVDYLYLKRIQKIEAMGIERDMTGLLTMEVPIEIMATQATSENKAIRTELETMLSQLKRDEREYALIPSELNREGLPSGFKLKLLPSGGTRQIDTSAVKRDYKVNMLQSVMAQILELGMGATGSFALASSSTNLFSVALGTYMDIIANAFSKQAISRLMIQNGVSFEYHPKLVHGDIETPDLAQIGSYITSLASAGQLPYENKPIQNKLLEYAKLPIPKEEAEETEQATQEGIEAQPAGVAPTGDVQRQALNGAQITSLIDIAARVNIGELSTESAIAILQVAVPEMSYEEAKRIAGKKGASVSVETGNGDFPSSRS